jgi:hypothetical protein
MREFVILAALLTSIGLNSCAPAKLVYQVAVWAVGQSYYNAEMLSWLRSM